jgi:AhpD family alkylhydroperoxidase
LRQAEIHPPQLYIVSLLQSLPDELLLDIVGHLAFVDILNLSAASKDLQALCQRWNNVAQLDELTNMARGEFAYRYHNDRFQQLCEVEKDPTTLEETDLAASAKLLCSFCLDLHPTAAFKAAETSKTIRESQCRGSKFSLYIFPTRRYTFTELVSQRYAPNYIYSEVPWIKCPETCRYWLVNPEL